MAAFPPTSQINEKVRREDREMRALRNCFFLKTLNNSEEQKFGKLGPAGPTYAPRCEIPSPTTTLWCSITRILNQNGRQNGHGPRSSLANESIPMMLHQRIRNVESGQAMPIVREIGHQQPSCTTHVFVSTCLAPPSSHDHGILLHESVAVCQTC